MGTIKQGILGGFNGKVGTVIGSSWKGITYMRGQSQHVKNPRTAGQIYSRTAFKAVSENYKAAVVNQDGTPVVDYSKLILSKGNIKPFANLYIDDMSQNGNYYIYTMMDGTQYPEYEGLIFFIYDIEDDKWQAGVIKQHYDVGESLIFRGGMPLLATKQYLGFACVYDPATGQVSNPIENVEAMGG